MSMLADDDNRRLVDAIGVVLEVLAKDWLDDGGDPLDADELTDYLFNVGPHEFNEDRCVAAARHVRDAALGQCHCPDHADMHAAMRELDWS